MPKTRHEGARWRYVHGCRCTACTKANADYQREYMSRRYVPANDEHSWGYGRIDGSLHIRGPRKGMV